MTSFLINSYWFAAGVDVDALAYINAVETADGQALETGVKDAIIAFVVGCKADGIWTAIKASCILAGARTLSGALVPLVGTAPTNNNFVSGDYNRETGLLGNGSTKYLNSNRNNNADPQNSKHGVVYVSSNHTSRSSGASNNFPAFLGTGANATGAFVYGRLSDNSTSFFARANNGTADTPSGANTASGLTGISRSASASYTFRTSGSSSTITRTSETPYDGAIGVFREGAGAATATTYSNARLAFYSIGESLNLSLLDSRVSTLLTAYAAAIP